MYRSEELSAKPAYSNRCSAPPVSLVWLVWLASFQELPASLVLPELQVSGAPLVAGLTSCWWGRARPFRQNESDWCHRLRWCQIGPANLRRSPYLRWSNQCPFRPRRLFHP